jgi:SagB-type dehydrogenase family enzyme
VVGVPPASPEVLRYAFAAMRVFWVFAPIGLFATFVLIRALLGRPLSRRGLDIGVALLLLAYLAVTAGLGLFWVARMDLPVFDWHYLCGYALLLVAAAHVGLQLRGLVRFFRPRAAKPMPAPRAGGPRQPGALAALAGMIVIVGVGLMLVARPRQRSVPSPPERVAQTPREASVPVVDRLYRDSSYSRGGLIRSVGLAPARPAETKEYPRRARLRLPEAPRHAGVTFRDALGRLDSADIALSSPTLPRLLAILFHANGVTSAGPGYRLRAAASSGALYPTDLYVVSSALPELPPGAHYYDGTSHELVAVGGAGAVEGVRAALPDLPGLRAAPVLLVFAGTFDRTAWKYNIRSYRYLGLDAGHVALNVLTAAAALGIACDPVPVFDDERLSRALAFDPAVEAPLLVFACGAPAAPAYPAVSPRFEPTPVPADAAAIELTRLSASLTSVRLSGGFDWLHAPTLDRAPAPHRLPPGSGNERDLFELIRARRSFREFTPVPVSKSAFAEVLVGASRVVGWLRSVALVEIFVAVRAVEGIEAGTYRYDAERHALSAPLKRGPVAIEQAGLDQAVLGRAAFVLAWGLLDERAGQLDGARDFRHAALEAGLSGEAAYLAANAAGLGSCGVGAFYDGEVSALFRSEDRAPRILYLAGVGAKP